MKVILNVFIVPPDAPECIAAEMKLRQLDPKTIQMSLSSGVTINFKPNEMSEVLDMFANLMEETP